MDIQALVKEAREKDSTFKFKYDYWTVTRNKFPDLYWLMPLLESALGEDYVQDAAYAYIKSKE